MSLKVTRACDPCRIRKVRCTNTQPCAQCAHLNLACTFAPAPAKRKPGERGRLVAQLRKRGVSGAGSGNANLAPNTRSSPGCASPPGQSPTSSTSGSERHDSDNASVSTALTYHSGHVDLQCVPALPVPTAGIGGHGYTQDFFMLLMPDFERHVYPVNPVLTPDEMRAAIANMHNDYEDAALVHAFGAVTINLTNTSWDIHGRHGDVASQMSSLLQLSMIARSTADISGHTNGSYLQHEMPLTVKRVMAGIWNECSLMAFKRFDRSFASLRESICMLQMLNIHQYSEETPHGLTITEISRLQRLYWEAYIHERFVCIMSGLPTALAPLPSPLPLTDPTVPPYVTVGFNRLIRLFQLMDTTLLAHWTTQSLPSAPTITAEWIETKQAQLDADEAETAEATQDLLARSVNEPDITPLTEEQHADLFVTRLWLRTLVWQLALSHGLLRSAPPRDAHEGFSLHFPAARLSSQLRQLVSRLRDTASIITHGSGILQKLFEITSTVADVLALPLGPGQTREEEGRARVEDFLFVVRFLFGFERAQKHHREYLLEKLQVLRGMYTVVDFEGVAGSPGR
ncbi:C6 transcription factor [Dichotomopilus funicola]|uniref:C6 transcription factor n=1 Tax=Dichotomopilus funicola TaxID=1934379 RepID=A0AAN6UYL4_9PEZI|nr:C6 transcription factor [Dichotomopilus funicola]